MKITASKSNLLSGLSMVCDVVQIRATVPVLQYVSFVVSNGGLSLSTTNLDQSITCRVSLNSVEEEGSIVVQARKFMAFVKNMSSETITIETDTKGRCIIIGGGSKFIMNTLPSGDFPEMPSASGSASSIRIEQDALFRYFKSLSYSASSDENRYMLNGVFFHLLDGELSLVSTDGRRLGIQKVDFESDETVSSIIPLKAVGQLEKILGCGEMVNVKFDKKRVGFDIEVYEDSEDLLGAVTFNTKVIDAKYPNYRQVIPQAKEQTQTLKVERELLASVIHRAALVTSDKSLSVKFQFAKEGITLAAESAQYGDFKETIEGNFGVSSPVKLALNPKFILETLGGLTADEITLEIVDEIEPLVVISGQFKAVIMPLRLN